MKKPLAHMFVYFVVIIALTGCSEAEKAVEHKPQPSVETVKNFENEIDKHEAECLAKTSSTEAMSACTAEAQKAWEAEIDKYYKLLKETLPEAEFVILEQSQKDWIQYKDSDVEFINSSIRTIQGTMFINVESGLRNEIVKQRALELKNVYNTLIF